MIRILIIIFLTAFLFAQHNDLADKDIEIQGKNETIEILRTELGACKQYVAERFEADARENKGGY